MWRPDVSYEMVGVADVFMSNFVCGSFNAQRQY